MKLNFKLVRNAFILGTAITLMVACDKTDQPAPPAVGGNDFQVAYSSGSKSQTQVIMQGVADVTQGVISFEKAGYKVGFGRTCRLFTSNDGSIVYSLLYRVGTIDKLSYNGGDYYKPENKIDASKPLKEEGVRFTKMSDEEASVHHISAKPAYSETDETKYIGHEMIASIGILDLKKMEFKKGFKNKIEVKIDESLAKAGYFIGRIDAPVVSNGKLYYGASVSKYDPATNKDMPTDKTFTLVVDYNDLSKVNVITTEHVQGSTNGYRTPTIHKNEAGEILQLVTGKDKTYIAKIKNGKYDESFAFDLNKALSINKSSSNGWFYAGNGIGYLPYEKRDLEKIQIGVNPQGKPSYSADWGLARIDLNNGTAVDLETPAKLWLTQYQNAIIRDGVFYIALAPVSGKGNIYMFDVNSTSPKGKKGAEITSGADQYYIGIY